VDEVDPSEELVLVELVAGDEDEDEDGGDPSKPNALAAVSFGSASPNPQPPSRSWAMIAPAQSAEWKPQHPEAQSASEEQRPVMNCLPCPLPARPGLLLELGVAGVSRAAKA